MPSRKKQGFNPHKLPTGFEFPPVGAKFTSRKSGTRYVVDRTFGNDVVFIQGRLPANAWHSCYHKRCTPTEWVAYAKTAKRIK